MGKLTREQQVTNNFKAQHDACDGKQFPEETQYWKCPECGEEISAATFSYTSHWLYGKAWFGMILSDDTFTCEHCGAVVEGIDLDYSRTEKSDI